MLPAWLVFGWLIFSRVGWTGWGVFLLAPTVALILVVLAILVQLRAEVRTTKAISWIDVICMLVFALSIIGVGFYRPSSWGFAVLALVAAVAWFWYAIAELSTEGKQRVDDLKSRFNKMAGGSGTSPNSAVDPKVIIVNENLPHPDFPSPQDPR